MSGKGIVSKTDRNTVIFRLVQDGKIVDRIEVDDVYVIDEVDGGNEAEIARRICGVQDED